MSIGSSSGAQQRPAMAGAQPLSLAAWGWIIWEAGRLPYLLTICTFVFLPYVATNVADDPVAAQIHFAWYAVAGGLATALTLPVLGIGLNGLGRRKPVLIATTSLMVPLLVALWWVKPGGPITSDGGLALVVLLNVLHGYGELVHNSMSPSSLGRGAASRLSSATLAVGNMAAVLVLGVVFCGLVLPLSSGTPFAAQRATGPLVAVLLVVTALPLLAWMPDAPGSGVPIAEGLRELGGALRRMIGDRDALGLLAARTLYVDGMMALMQFGGLFATGAIRANAPERIAVAILLALGGSLGALLAGNLDNLLGPRRVMRIGIGFLSVWLLARLGKRLLGLFLPPSLVVVIYLALAILGSGAFVGAASASRFMLCDPTSATRIGVYALSAAATAWLGPLLIGVATTCFHSQAAGFIPIILLLGGGLVGMSFAKGGEWRIA
jgi:MFS transporter, UMF1 family